MRLALPNVVVMVVQASIGLLETYFVADLREASRITLEQWRRRSYGERALAFLGRLLERQV